MHCSQNLPLHWFILIWLSTLCATSAHGENWPQWRGPRGDGVSREKNLSIDWDENRGVTWKCSLLAWGTSTPAIHGDAIFVTTHADDDQLLLTRIDKRDGHVVWQRQVGDGTAPRQADRRTTQKFHRLHNLASPSPVTDGRTVVAHFGNGDLAAYDFSGQRLWKRNLQKDYGAYSIWWGHANSPVLFEGMAISVCMQDSLADMRDDPVESYLVAHDLRDGHVKWKTSRVTKADAEQCDSYTTPLLMKVNNRLQLVVMGGNQLDAYDPANGKQLWYLPGLVGGRTITGPTAGLGMIFTTQGMRGPLLAVRPGEKAELSQRDVVWDYNSGTSDTCSGVIWDTLLFTVTDDGVAHCHDALTGNLHWKKRLTGKFKASPLAADGRIYFLNTEGLCSVVSAATRWNRLTENQLDDEFLASPAVSDGKIFLRGRHALYCIGASSR